uniref:Uncharacterized protein n=1 Tax=Glossina brevipalpis TaxID=37001 RepID=A0A1A9WQW0_9MUSC
MSSSDTENSEKCEKSAKSKRFIQKTTKELKELEEEKLYQYIECLHGVLNRNERKLKKYKGKTKKLQKRFCLWKLRLNKVCNILKFQLAMPLALWTRCVKQPKKLKISVILFMNQRQDCIMTKIRDTTTMRSMDCIMTVTLDAIIVTMMRKIPLNFIRKFKFNPQQQRLKFQFKFVPSNNLMRNLFSRTSPVRIT